MREEDRKDKIAEFINTQAYTHGLSYKILSDGDDRFTIQFVEASYRAITSLQRRFILNDMHHIHVTAIKVIDFEKKTRRKKR